MTPTVAVENPNASMLEKTICLTVFTGRPGNSKKVKNQAVDIDSDALHVSKTLLESPEYEAIKSFDRATDKWLDSKSVPSFFRRGVVCIPFDFVEQVDSYLETREVGRLRLIDVFMEMYDQRKAEAQTRLESVKVGEILKDLFDPQDYPPNSLVRASFRFEYHWVNMGTPGKLKMISQAFFNKAKERASVKWEEAEQNITVLRRMEFKGLVDHLVDRLAPDEKGGMKRFHKTTVEKVRKFLDSNSIKNVTNDEELDQLVNATRKLLEGVDVDSIKDSDHLRSNIQKGFGIVKDCLDQLVVEGGTRKISFLDEA